MNVEFHYYAIYFLALRAGFAEDEARRLAMSSQYVDDAIYEYEVVGGSGPLFLPYNTIVTQNYSFWDGATRDSVYLPFHFIPGDGAKAGAARKDGCSDPYQVTPDSPIAKKLLVAALKTRNLYRVGIALHSYADSWAHQQFSGLLSEVNVVDPASPLPAVGHLQALRSPDQALETWHDPRLLEGIETVDNRSRFLEAARKVYRYLRAYNRLGFEDEGGAMQSLSELWARDGRDMRSRIADFIIADPMEAYDRRVWPAEAGIRDETAEDGHLAGYDKFVWLKTAIAGKAGGLRGVRRVECRKDFALSELYAWNEAARAHRDVARGIFRREGPLGETNGNSRIAE
jgi:hypothetical protein